MRFEPTLLAIVAVIVAVCNCEPEPQFLANPYPYGVYGAIGRSPNAPVAPRIFPFTSLIKPLFTYTFSTTTTTTTVTSTTTSTCTTSTASLAACTRRRRRGVVVDEVDDWFIRPAAPAVQNIVQNTQVQTVDSLRKSRQEELENVGVFYASEYGVEGLQGSVPARTFLISYYVLTSTQTATETSTITSSVTAICSSTTTYSLCT